MDVKPFEVGNVFHLKVFGSSHGPNVGVEVTGCPKGFAVSESDIQIEFDKRKPVQRLLTSQR